MRHLILSAALCLGLVAPGLHAQGGIGYAAATAAIAAEDWDLAYALATPEGDIARDLVTWQRLRAGAGTFPDYGRFLAARPDWPGLDRLRAKGEEAITPDTPPAEVVAYFATAKPQTGQGAARLAEALALSGRNDAARDVLREAWLGLGLTDEGQAALMALDATALAPHHVGRTDAMLWRWRTSDAARMLPLLPDDQRLLAEARIALITNAPDRATKVAAVPAALQGHPGLAYDRFNRLAESGDYSDAVSLLMARSGDAAALGEPFRWASWRATLARWAMREGRPQEAFDIATRHHLSGGDQFADLEWVAGYVALSYLDDPARALRHFQTVEMEVTGPISRARGGYWVGRAQEALGDPDAATEAFGRAAQNQTAFYGLLAAERLGLPLDPALAGREAVADWRQAGWLQEPLAQAMLTLLAARDRGTAVLFVARLGQTLERDQIAQLGAMLAQMDEPFLTVLLGKAAVERGIVLPAIYFPLHPLADLDLPVSRELALSIARRESEFNAVVGSPVGALGLMQLMPATAEEVAGELGLPYARGRLTSDWAYNATLGARYLANLERSFGPSPVMIAAGYNAGPSRPRNWMQLRGDPRKGEVDVVDWIEHIPFAETRNYVMRVTESMPVYRARLSGATGPVAFRALLVGELPPVPPPLRPLLRGDPRPEAMTADVTTSGPVVAAPVVIRPQLRP